MSAAAEFWVTSEVMKLLKDKTLSKTEFVILLFMATKSRNDYYNMWWGERRIAAELACSQGTISKAVKKFQQLELLHVRKGTVKNKKHKEHNIYYLHVPNEYRRRGHKAVNGESIPEDFNPITGEFDHDQYEERLQWDFEKHDEQYQEIRKQEGLIHE